MNIVSYIYEKEIVTLNEVYSEMIENKWNANISIHDKSQLAAVLRHRLCHVVNTGFYKVAGKETLYSLSENWNHELLKGFDAMKEKGERWGRYGVEE